MLPEALRPVRGSDVQDAALTCYLSAMLAMAQSMRAVCSRAGLNHGARLTRLPRRLGFDATSEALEQSRKVLEAELAEYTDATGAWIDAGCNLASEIVSTIEALDLGAEESSQLHAAMLEDLAAHMEVSAEVESDLRGALKRYATGLRGYLKRRRVESRSSLKDLQGRAGRLAEWLARADPSTSTDPATGLPNRQEIERRLESFGQTGKTGSVLVFEWKEANPAATAAGTADSIALQLADRLADMVRPRDIVGCWSPNQFAVIFECSGPDALQRAGRIAEWLTDEYSAIVDGALTAIYVDVTVRVIERLPEETAGQLIHRLEQLRSKEAAVPRNA